MKTTLKLISVIILLGLFSACEDATSIEQPGTLVPETTFESVEDLQKGLNSVYGNYSRFDAIFFNAVFTDNIKRGTDNTGGGQGLYNYRLNPTSGSPTGIWVNRYATINFANRVLDAYHELEYATVEEQQAADIIAGQLYGIRALCHLDLYQYFSESYTDDNALSVPIMDFVPENLDIEPTRNTVGEVVNFIHADLDKAESLMGSTDLGAAYMSKTAFQAMRARLMLFHGQDDPAIMNQVIDTVNTILAQVPVADATEYPNIFTDQSNAGVIYKRRYTTNDGEIASIFYFNQVDRDGDPIYEVSNELFNQFYQGNAADVRFNVVVKPVEPDPFNPNGNLLGSLYFGQNDPRNILLIYKYPGSSRSLLTNDDKIIRSAEMLLIKAEAQARSGDISGAQSSINELLSLRYTSGAPTVSFSGQNDALITILEQRRLELAFEAHRYLDLKRFRDVTNQGVTRLAVDCNSFSALQCDLPKNDHRWVFPIPQAELNANSKIQQNPGY